jgi:hypothetical protein
MQIFSWSATLDLGLHLIQVLRPKLSAQPNRRSSLVRKPFDLQRHQFSGSEMHARLRGQLRGHA